MKSAWLAVLLLCAAALPAQNSFDHPLKKMVVDLGPSPYHPGDQHERIRLSCYFFPTFVVKEYDEREVGAEWLSIAPVAAGATGECTKSHVAGERLINPDDWSGYFKGVRGSLVFFDAPDGLNGGLPFAIFEAGTLKKLFEDTAYDASMYARKPPPSPFNRLRVSSDADQRVVLRYLRVVAVDCDLHREKNACWEQVRRKLGLEDASMPVCSDYERAAGRLWPSAIAYPVEVSLAPVPRVRHIPGPLKCWPAD